MADLPKRINSRGYWEFLDPKTGQWVEIHRRAAEKKYGSLPEGTQVHHRDGNPLNNRWNNLALLTPRMHGRQHNEPDACDRCGRLGHWAADCKKRTDYKGDPLPVKRKTRPR